VGVCTSRLLKSIFGSKKNEVDHSDCAVKACYVLCLPHVCRSPETCPPFVLPGVDSGLVMAIPGLRIPANCLY